MKKTMTDTTIKTSEGKRLNPANYRIRTNNEGDAYIKHHGMIAFIKTETRKLETSKTVLIETIHTITHYEAA